MIIFIKAVIVGCAVAWFYFILSSIRTARRHPHCQQAGCNSRDVIACRLLDENGKEIIEYYCPEHACQNGYCMGCGRFCAGLEEFDFPTAYGNIPGCCDICSDAIKADCDDYNNEDDDGD